MDIATESAYLTPLINSAINSTINSTILSTLLLSLMKQRNAPKTTEVFSTEYDYIVVGAGSAGSVVASRLSEIPCVKVLLLEAGKSPPYITEIPGIAALLWNTDLDWTYRIFPQRYTGRLMQNRQTIWRGGKMLGGSSSLNFMIFARGNRMNYENWAAEGAEGWGYKDVYPYFLKMEDNRDPEYVANGYHNVGGLLTVQRPWYEAEIKNPIFKAAKALGYNVVDPNGARQTGFYDIQTTMRKGQRCSTAKAYLVPAENRTNLDIVTNAMVRKVVIQNGRAVGVEFDFQGRTHIVRARREVIMSAGTINTAHLLMLSGIGPIKELKRHKIPVVADLPVGRNLQNHYGMIVNFELSSTIQPAIVKLANPLNIARYIANRTGPLASAQLISAFAWGKGDEVRPKVDFPNFELLLAEGFTFREGLLPEVIKQVYGPYEGKPLYGCIANLMQPRSRGTVELNSTDPYDLPIIDPNYFEDPRDMDDVVDGLKLCNRIGNSPELRSVGSVPFQTVFPGCEPFVGDEDAYFRCLIKSFVVVYPSQVGTARMGHPMDPRSVVDPQLRVKGVKGLRVADSSIMPIIPTGGTYIPSVMIGEKASDIIKATIQCKTYGKEEEWWHAPDDSWWSAHTHYPLFGDLDFHMPFNAYQTGLW